MNSVGLLVIHGIGAQRPGELSRTVATGLSEFARLDRSGSLGEHAPMRSKAETPLPSDAFTSVERVAVDGVSVVIAEANWSELSSPDNPPRVCEASPIVRDYRQTIPQTWRRLRLVSAMRRLDRRGFRVLSAILLAAIGTVYAVLLSWPLFMGAREPPAALTAALGLLMLGPAAHFAVRSARYRRLKLRRQPRARRLLQVTIWATGGFLLGVALSFMPVVIAAEILFFFAVPVVVAYVVGWIFVAVVAAIRVSIVRIHGRRLAAVQRWIYRLTWVMLVLPCHVFLQAIRAAGNLISIAFTESAWPPRLVATAGLLGVYVAFLLLLVICEILLLPALVVGVLQIGESTWPETTTVALLSLALLLPPYLLLVKLCLPAIDLLLDVANYHLACDVDRRSYYERLEAGAAVLVAAGCTQIHLFAHSLGTVLVYDWLRLTPPGKYPITVLHTLGSPLDKFWYIDHSAARRRADHAGLDQHSLRAWFNFWAWSDPVSGNLDHFDGLRLLVANERLHGLGAFLVSHVNYWTNSAVLARVREQIAGRAP